jgi:hypothetical protein
VPRRHDVGSGLKRVFNIDIATCQDCGGAMKVIACIEDPEVIQKILTHLQLNAEAAAPSPLPEPRAPPFSDLFDSLWHADFPARMLGVHAIFEMAVNRLGCRWETTGTLATTPHITP